MTQQKNEVKTNAGAKNNDKELKLINGWEIVKSDLDYMISNRDVFIHGDTLTISSKNTKNIWLNVHQDGHYVASVWIDSPKCIKKIRKFIKKTMVCPLYDPIDGCKNCQLANEDCLILNNKVIE